MKNILYTFRRCPYAIRARMTLLYAGIPFEKIEVDFKNKPQALLDISPKGTVPVLVEPNGNVIDESLDIMLCALAKNDPDNWLAHVDNELIELIGGGFKNHLNRYKYADRYPDENIDTEEQKNLALNYLYDLEKRFSGTYLFGEKLSFTDVAIFSLVRQFIRVDEESFMQLDLPKIQRWYKSLSNSELFLKTMAKTP